MKKIKCLVVSLLLITAITNAAPVLENTAVTVAGNYYSQTYHATAQILTLVYTETSSDGQPVYYVFDVNSNDGFIIVSAEDAGYPIIGSSNTGKYVIPTTNNNVGYWMSRRKNEIISMRANNIQATADISATWNVYKYNTSSKSPQQALSSVAPLLGSITWDQSPFYNAMCPHNSVTGCVATAMAQIMKYWSYPSVGLGSWCYYDVPPTYTENYGQLCAEFDTSNYVWSAMPNILTSANKQVAKLMYDCGVSVNMDYSPTESGSYVINNHGPSALNSYVEYFNYYKWSIKGVIESQYTTSKWVSLIENELNSGRPVQYQGTDNTYGGHSWVCDGYNGSNLFHMNWGWSGQDNGYYSPTDLAPTGSGYDFSDADVGAIIGIMPPSKALAVDQISTNQSFKIYPNPSNGILNVELESITGNPQITIYNVLGQQVYATKLTAVQTSINMGNQSKGVYLYRVLNENGTSVSTGRLVVE